MNPVGCDDIRISFKNCVEFLTNCLLELTITSDSLGDIIEKCAAIGLL